MPITYQATYTQTSTYIKGYLVKYDCADSSFDLIKTTESPNASIEFYKVPKKEKEKTGAFRISHCHSHQILPSFLTSNLSQDDKTELARHLKHYQICILNLEEEIAATKSKILKKMLFKELAQDKVNELFLKSLVDKSFQAVVT